MTAKDIQQKVFYLFNNHQYHLYNSYVYNWECDYFSSTKSNNDYEVEIKISRSDFFADLKRINIGSSAPSCVVKHTSFMTWGIRKATLYANIISLLYAPRDRSDITMFLIINM